MVRKEDNFWVCEECEMKYKSSDFADKCEKYCKKNKSCSLEIIKHAEK
jgi:hypothetical protein